MSAPGSELFNDREHAVNDGPQQRQINRDQKQQPDDFLEIAFGSERFAFDIGPTSFFVRRKRHQLGSCPAYQLLQRYKLVTLGAKRVNYARQRDEGRRAVPASVMQKDHMA